MAEIHKLGGFGFDSNVYLIKDETIALIDSGTGMRFERLRSELKRAGVEPEDVELLVNTHCHFDHAGADHLVAGVSGCEIAIHEMEVKPLEEGDSTISCAVMFGKRLQPVEVSRVLREGDGLKLGELSLRVLHTPGHTAGGICLYDQAQKLLFSGDTVFCDGVGRTDLPTGDERALLNSLHRLSELEIERLYPGHGEAAEKRGQELILQTLKMLEGM
jgi:glyoxylase-like metal-dependent hydrolase (beta-lactamase superfamily II)